MKTTGTYFQNPQSLEEFLNNAAFQIQNVEGWMSVGQTENARIKARCLLEAVEKLVDAFAQKELEAATTELK